MEAGSATRPRLGELVDVTIDTLAHGGAGVGRLDGYVVFVRQTVPGDRVRAQITKRKRAYAEARPVELLEPSPDRIEPAAAHPGAPWQVLPYERQLEIKHEQVGDALRRIGRLEGFELDPIVPAEQQWRYRNKVEFSFGTNESGELICGFHAPAAGSGSSGWTTACWSPSASTPCATPCSPTSGCSDCRRGTAATRRASCATSRSARAG